MAQMASASAQRLYLTRIQEEHGRIFQAICDADAAEARRAMRAHLTRSLARYRRLAERKPGLPEHKRQRTSLMAPGRT
jgi:DNA-binding FadR family transcriptional regulator